MLEIKNILNDNEWKPSYYDKKWKKINNEYYIYPKTYTPHIMYTIDKSLIKEMLIFAKLYKNIKNNKNLYRNTEKDKSIIRIYKISSIESPNKFIVGETAGSLLRLMKISLHQYIINPLNKYNYFTKLNILPIDAKFELLEYVKKANRDDLNKLKKEWIKKLNKKNNGI